VTDIINEIKHLQSKHFNLKAVLAIQDYLVVSACARARVCVHCVRADHTHTRRGEAVRALAARRSARRGRRQACWRADIACEMKPVQTLDAIRATMRTERRQQRRHESHDSHLSRFHCAAPVTFKRFAYCSAAESHAAKQSSIAAACTHRTITSQLQRHYTPV
jgi:hypothetical protein